MSSCPPESAAFGGQNGGQTARLVGRLRRRHAAGLAWGLVREFGARQEECCCSAPLHWSSVSGVRLSLAPASGRDFGPGKASSSRAPPPILIGVGRHGAPQLVPSVEDAGPELSSISLDFDGD